MANPIREQKNYDGVTLWKLNSNNTVISVDIVKIEEYDPFATSNRPKYRVDYNGYTYMSLETLTNCKKKARQIIKENLK